MTPSEFVLTDEAYAYDSGEKNIHMPGHIQPHGILLVLTEPNLTIIQVSNNTHHLLGIPADHLLMKSLEVLVGSQQFVELKRCLSKDFERVNPLTITIESRGQTSHFNGLIHRHRAILILELQPRSSASLMDFIEFNHLTRPSINSLERASNLYELCQNIVQEVRKLTGFDRVLLYRFQPDESGVVIAEDKPEMMESYLGLHYPGSDIPQATRRLFASNWVRLIPDVGYQPVEMIPAQNPVTQDALDLSFSLLRGVSPCHLEYLKNMGVAASMSISLVKNKKNWGLIACHHLSPKHVNYEVLTICELLGKLMSLELVSREESEDLEYKIQLKSTQTKLVDAVAKEQNFVDGFVKFQPDLLELVGATGAAVYWNGRFITVGQTPEESEIQSLIAWIEPQLQNGIFSTDKLPQQYPAAAQFKETVSGVLAVSVSQLQKGYILWFRPEVIQTVNWGGNPSEGVEMTADGQIRLSPRTSFHLWQETVSLTSLPWKRCEIEAALEFKTMMIELVLRRADELAKINMELKRSNDELDAFAYIASHDLKEPLRGIHNYSNFLIEDYGDVLNEEGTAKLQTLVRLTQRMEDLIDSLLHFSRLGRVDLAFQSVDLNQLLKSVLEVLAISTNLDPVEIQICDRLPVMRCDRVQVSEVFSNLISNAIKYNDKPHKRVEIGLVKAAVIDNAENIPLAAEQPVIFYIKDNGIGIREKHHTSIFRIFKRLHAPTRFGGGTGAGLTIAQRIVERHGGRLWLESIYGEGSTFYFTLQP